MSEKTSFVGQTALGEAAMALANLARWDIATDQPCWCDVSIGNPMVTRHTDACVRARLALQRVKQETDSL